MAPVLEGLVRNAERCEVPVFTPGKNVFCRVEGSAAELAKSVRMLGFVLLIDFQHMVVCDAEQRGGRPSKDLAEGLGTLYVERTLQYRTRYFLVRRFSPGANG